MKKETMSLMGHLEELRRVLIVSLIATLLGTFVAFYYSDWLLAILKRPIDQLELKLVFIGVTEGFFTKITLALYGGFVLAFPVIVWELWRFVSPALYSHEQRYILILMPVAIALFVGGILFSYFTVFPIATVFLLTISGDIEPMITISKFVSFAISFLLPFGLIFELPLVVMFLSWLGLITPQFLKTKRKYALLICFVIGAVLTPTPDPVSQVLMAGPMYLLYEVSIVVARFVKARKQKAAEEELAADEEPAAGKTAKIEEPPPDEPTGPADREQD